MRKRGEMEDEGKMRMGGEQEDTRKGGGGQHEKVEEKDEIIEGDKGIKRGEMGSGRKSRLDCTASSVIHNKIHVTFSGTNLQLSLLHQ